MSTPQAPSSVESRPWYRRRWLALTAAACLLIAAIPIGLMIAGRVAPDRQTEIALDNYHGVKRAAGFAGEARPQDHGVIPSVTAEPVSLPSDEDGDSMAPRADLDKMIVSGSRDSSSQMSRHSVLSDMSGSGAAPTGEKAPPATDPTPPVGMPASGVAGPADHYYAGAVETTRGVHFHDATPPQQGGYGGMEEMMGMGSGQPRPGAEGARYEEGMMGSGMGSYGPASQYGRMTGESESALQEAAPAATPPAGMDGADYYGGYGSAQRTGQSPAPLIAGRPLPRRHDPVLIGGGRQYNRRPTDLAVVPRDGSNMRGLGEGRYDVELDIDDATVPGTEQYEAIVENKFLPVAVRPLSTFSIDVDTASYTNVRRFLNQGRLPPPSAVRIEEMVNYFRYDYAPPDDETPFSVDIEVAQCPWRAQHRLLRVGLKGREIERDQRGPSNLVFLLDVSGSMRDDAKLPLVKRAMRLLVEQLNEDDRVAIVTYASDAGLKLESTCASEKRKILDAIDSLSAGGSTHGSAGIQLAYQQAAEHFVEGGTNRVILATDGDLNVGVTDDDALVKLIRKKAKSGVFLTVLGFGTGNLKDAKMEKLADHGNGVYAYLDNLREAQKVLVEQISASLVTIAKDVKIQIEFNPAEVAAYRLLGYENRVMAAQDFDNDKKDAGEIGAGHTVTALYELVPTGEEPAQDDPGSMLKYQRVPPQQPPAELTDEASTGELLTLRLRYKEPDGAKSKLLEFVTEDSGKRFAKASPDFQFAAAVVSFGLVMRRSQYMGELTLSAVEEFAVSGLGDDSGGYRAEFVDLVQKARKLSGQ